MTRKQSTIKLEYRTWVSSHGGPLDESWKVIQVTDSTHYHPGQLLRKDEVEMLCANGGWKVTIGKDTRK